MPRIWSEEQIQYLIDNHDNPNETITSMSKVTGVPKSTLTCKLNELGLKENYDKIHKKGWTKEELEYLNENYDKMSLKELSKGVGKAPSTVSLKLIKLGLDTKYKKEHYWTDEEIEYLLNNYSTSSMRALMKHLNKTESSIEGQLKRQGVERKIKGNWTEDELNYLKENFDRLDYSEISKKINRSVPSISNKAHELGLTKGSINRTKLKKVHIDFILENYMKYTDSEMSEMFGVSDQAIAEVRVSNVIRKTGNEDKGPTYIERFVMNLLEELEVKYLYNTFVGRYKPDMYIEENNIVIEVHGDYFHCNPVIYGDGPIDNIQEKHVLRDYYKMCYYKSRGYRVLYIWENDIKNNPNKVKEKISAVLRGNS